MNTDNDSPLTERLGPTYRLWQWCQRNPAVAALTASNVVLMVMTTVGFTVMAAQIAGVRDREHAAPAVAERTRRDCEARLQSALEEIERLKQSTGNEK